MTETAPRPPAPPEVAAATDPLRVLLVHNRYRLPGGEDVVFEAEALILGARGHAVETLELHNDEVDESGKLALAANTVWSRASRERIERVARAHRADVVHFHNTLPLVSPSGYYGARASGAAVVQTLHNYRTICPGALLYRDGAPCELCVGKAFALPGVRHGCYRGSSSATLAVATMTAAHRALGTWNRAVDRYIAITTFARDKFAEGGLPSDRLAVKPNPLRSDPGMGHGGGGFALYVGRLDTGKGVEVIAEAWRQRPDLPPLIVVGDGPLAPVISEAGFGDRVQCMGWQDQREVIALMKRAAVLVFPSEVYEGGTPMSIVEAFACGLPVIGSDRGAMKGMIEHGETGYRFEPGNPTELADTVHQFIRPETDRQAFRARARAAFTSTYTPDANHDRLVSIYREAITQRAHA